MYQVEHVYQATNHSVIKNTVNSQGMRLPIILIFFLYIFFLPDTPDTPDTLLINQ